VTGVQTCALPISAVVHVRALLRVQRDERLGLLQVIGLFRPTQPGDQAEAEALIALYTQQSPHVHYRSANVDTDVADVKLYSVTEADTVVLDYNGKTQLLLPGSQTEQDFTSALLKLESSRVPMVCWAVGDAERELSDVTNST